MAKRRVSILCFFTALAAAALWPARGEAQSETVRRIVPGVWFRQGDLENLGHCNNVIIEMKDYLIVVDANFPSGARAVMADVKRISSKPVKYVFVTHHHGDHAYGNSLWTEYGATTIAYKSVADEMRRLGAAGWKQAAARRPDVRELNRTEPELPRQTFDKSPYVIKDGKRRVELYFFGWGHTRGDGFLYLPKEQVLCTGDAVTNGPYNFTGDSSIANWPNVLRQAQRLKITHVLPGHGPAGGKDLLEGQAQFLIELRKAVQAAIDQGKTLDDLVKTDGGKPVSTTIELPQNVQHWVGRSFAVQVREAYNQLKSGAM